MAPDLTPFENSNALLFGGAKGIGKAVALEWARRGARIAIADIDIDAASATAAEITANGGTAIAFSADVLSDESTIAAATEAEKSLGSIDIVMNNVGSTLSGYPEDIPFDEWHRMMDLNYFSVVRSIKYFLPKFLDRETGHIVNTASFAGLFPYSTTRIPYGTAKAAVLSLTQILAIYLEPQGIRVSCLVPGPVMTSIGDSMTEWTPNCPMRSSGSNLEIMLPEDVARVLADGMRDGAIVIPSDPTGFETIRRWADSPDAFIRSKIEEFARGDDGLPVIPDAILQQMRDS